MKKFGIILLSIIIVGLGIFLYVWFYVPFSDEGVKVGQLNDIKHKGIVFKTYEGKLIQSGFWAGQSGMQSNTFEFSVEDDNVAQQLKRLNENQIVKLHYKEYYGVLPWRGYSKYIVDSVEVQSTIQVPNHTNTPFIEQ